MNPHNFSIIACGVCGILMVVGSIWLLATGVITLSSASKDGTLSVEVANKVKISTTYPALGLFIIGLCFTALSLWFSEAGPYRPLAIVGKIHGVEDPNLVTVTVQPDQYGSAVSFGANSNGQLNKILPDIKQLTLTIAANGYSPQPYKATLNIDDAIEEPQRRRLNVPDEITFTKINSGSATVAAPPKPGHIEPTPADKNLEPFRAAATDSGTTEAVRTDTTASASPTP